MTKPRYNVIGIVLVKNVLNKNRRPKVVHMIELYIPQLAEKKEKVQKKMMVLKQWNHVLLKRL